MHDRWINPAQEYQTGPRNLITDVPGVRVGHADVRRGGAQTGVTVLLPRPDIFENKLVAACHVINGFGKSTGLVQVEELGTLETPIVLTNTLAVGTCWQALARRMVRDNPQLRSVNPVVMECNDSTLNDIRAFHVTGDMLDAAWDGADVEFAQGAVGAGRGMICHGLSGGIGSASRVFKAGKQYTIGALVLTNHGLLRDLTVLGDPVGRRLAQEEVKQTDQGSVIVILATDVPVSARNLKRICKRAVVGLGRSGARIGHGSGEIVLAFTTGNTVPHQAPEAVFTARDVSDAHMDTLFRAAIECVEEAVFNSLLYAEAVTGFEGRTVRAYRDACR